MNRTYILAWVLWIGGTILIVGSWTRIVPNKIGWIGFAVALGGTLLSHSGRATSEGSGFAIIVCPQCRQQLRLPTDKGQLAVRCPKCNCFFDFKPIGDGRS